MTDAERREAPDVAGRRRELDAIGAEVSVCTRCRLHETRTKAVPGEGHPDTEVVFVGEGPGFNEDRQGRPFVGRAGALLDELLRSVYWARDEVFITNVVKCRPPENRDPEPDEIAACAPFLARQLAVLDPALVVTLGRFSMGRFMPGARIGQVHGTFRPAEPSAGAPDALAFAMYHPAAALRQDALKRTLFADMQGVPQALLEARERRSAARGGREPAVAAVEGVEVAAVETVAAVEAVAGDAAIETVAAVETGAADAAIEGVEVEVAVGIEGVAVPSDGEFEPEPETAAAPSEPEARSAPPARDPERDREPEPTSRPATAESLAPATPAGTDFVPESGHLPAAPQSDADSRAQLTLF